MELSVHVEGNTGLTWQTWKQHVKATEALGFAGLFRSDHFTVEYDATPDVLELIVALTYAAEHTERIHFGPLVAPLSFRDPVTLAFQAAALDDLSSGRMILGVGTGWMEREHTMLGFELGTVSTRMDRLEEGLEVLTQLLRSKDPVTFTGRFYTLRDAVLRPLPERRGGPRILVGGRGVKRTLPLVARFADIWNVYQLTPEEFHERSTRLDDLLIQAGRLPTEVKRTFLSPVVCGRNDTEIARSVAWFRRTIPGGDCLSLDAVVDRMRTEMKAMVGTPDEIVAQMRAYAAVGAEELMIQLFDVNDFEMVHLLAESVLPHLRG